MKEKAEISHHEVKFFLASLELKNEWRTSKELSEKADVSPRSGRAYAKRFCDFSILEQRKVYPGFRFKLQANAENGHYFRRLKAAAEAFA